MKAPQQALSAAEIAAYEKLPVPMCVLRADGGRFALLAASDGFCALVGRGRDQLRQESAGDLCHLVCEDDRETAREAVNYTLMGAGLECRAVIRLRTAEQKLVRAVCTARAPRLGDGAFLLYLVFSCLTGEFGASGSLNEPEKAESRFGLELGYLRRSEDYELVSSWYADLTDGRTIEYNKASRFALPVDPAASYEETAAFIGAQPTVPEQRARLTQLLERQRLLDAFNAGEYNFSMEYRRIVDGEMPFWLRMVLSTRRSAATGHIELNFCAYDMTERILETQMLSRLTILGYDLVGLVYLKSNKCRFFRIKKLRFGMDGEEYDDYYDSINGDIETIIAPEMRDEVRRGLRLEYITGHLADEPIYEFPFSITTRDGRHRQKLLQFSYLDEAKDTLFLCKSDITRQYQAEHEQIEQLREAKLEADRANAAKSMFLSSMSHDLRTPIGGVLGFTDLALATSDAQKKQEYLEKVRSSGGLLLDLVNDTLELSRIESGKLELELQPVSVREMAQAVLISLQPSAEIKGLHVEADPASFPDTVVLADRLKFQKIFLNLLSNAIKYTPAGGVVRAAIERLDPPENGYTCRLTVSDTGIGICPEFLPHIFDAFSQERRPESANILGTGLGLAIVKRIVDLMHGSIAVDSAPGQGSRFVVELPLPPAREDVPPDAADAPAAPDLRGRCVLLCEDNYLNTEIARNLLEEKGMRVLAAENGERGVACFRASAPGEISAILMDLRMPVMDGLEAARHIRALDRPDAARVPILAMTADAFGEDLRSCADAGMDGHVTKPLAPRTLLQALQQAIGKNETPKELQS